VDSVSMTIQLEDFLTFISLWKEESDSIYKFD
jgi:hypothetical protein